MKDRHLDLMQVTARLVRVLGEEDCLVIGGLAVAGHGYVRATDDVDLVVRIPLSEARRRLEDHGIAVTMRRGDVLAGDFPCLRGTLGGVRFDVLPPLVPLEWEQALVLPSEKGGQLRLVDLEGLLRLKLRAQGVQDVLDVAVLVLRHPDYRDRALEIAAAYRIRERLESFLEDRRTRAAAEEQSARESGTKAGGRKRPPASRRRQAKK
jgi:hypothetical protein